MTGGANGRKRAHSASAAEKQLTINNGTLSFHGQEYRLRQYAGALVTVCLIPNQSLLVAWNEKRVGNFPLYPLSHFDFRGTQFWTPLDTRLTEIRSERHSG